MRLVAENISIVRNKFSLLDMSFVLPEGVSVLLGKNGSGKTSIIQSILGSVDYTGRYIFDGCKNVSYCPQSESVLNGDVIVRSFIQFNSSNSIDSERFSKYVSAFEIEDLLDRRLGSLSGGQRKRVMIVSSLYQNSDIVLLDEPFNELEPRFVAVLLQCLKEMNRIYLVVTHSISLAIRLSSRVFVIDNDRIVFCGTKIPSYLLSKVFGDCYYPTLFMKDVVFAGVYKKPVFYFGLLFLSLLLYVVFCGFDLHIIYAIIVGSILSCTGMTYQYLFQNRLCTPYTLGVSSATCLGSEIAIFMGLSTVFVELFAFCSSLILLFVLLFLNFRISRNRNSSIILISILISSVVSSIGIVLQMQSSPEVNQEIFRWQIGGLSYASYEFLYILPLLVLGWVFIYRSSSIFDIVSLGRDLSLSKGVDYDRFVTLNLIISTLMCSLVVSLTGPIGFIGLVVPNIVYSFYRDFRTCFVISTVLGSIFILLSEVVVSVLSGMFITSGVVTTVFGSLLLIPILMSRSDEH